MNWPSIFRFFDIDRLFNAVQSALEQSTEWCLRERGNLASDRFMSVDYIGNEFTGKDLGFALCNFPDEPSKVQLTMHAARWSDDRSHPTDTEYLSAERTTGSLFRHAARLLRCPLRLSRPRHPKRMVGKLAQAFRGFCVRTTDLWTGGKPHHLHQTKHEDFYRFICAAHRCASALTPEELHVELLNEGFTTELSNELTEQYEIGRRVLAMGTWRWHCTTVDVWNPWNVREDRKRSKARQRERDEQERRGDK
jgi:hypothetical protein